MRFAVKMHSPAQHQPKVLRYDVILTPETLVTGKAFKMHVLWNKFSGKSILRL